MGSDEEEKVMKGGGESSKEEVEMKGAEDMRWYEMGSNGDGSRVKVISALRTNRGGIELGMRGHVEGEKVRRRIKSKVDMR